MSSLQTEALLFLNAFSSQFDEMYSASVHLQPNPDDLATNESSEFIHSAFISSFSDGQMLL